MSVLPEWLPGMQFKKNARKWREQYDEIAAEAHEYVEKEIVSCLPRFVWTYAQLTACRLRAPLVLR